jgi:hypothetical protein
VDRIYIGVEQADGQGLDALPEEPVQHPLDVAGVEGREHFAPRAHPLVHLQAQVALDQGGGLLPGEVVETGHPDPTDLEDVTEAPGRDQPRSGPLELQDGVGGHRGAMDDLAHVAPAEPLLPEDVAEPLHDGARVVLHARGNLLGVDPPLGIEDDDVRERPADVDADAEPSPAHFRTLGSQSAMSGKIMRITTPRM